MKDSHDYSAYFMRISEIYSSNPHVFAQIKNVLEHIVVVHDGVSSFDTNYDMAVGIINVNLDDNIHTVFQSIHSDVEKQRPPLFSGLPDALRSEILAFSAFVAPLLAASVDAHKTKERRLAIAFQSFKATLVTKSLKKALIIVDWIVKWASYLQRESSFRPNSLKAYRQREIILVDFGFNVGGEFGGRHYAVVLEKNNNPFSSVILVAPISSYDQTQGQQAHKSNVDLGIGAIHGYSKGSQVVLNQIRYISKLRIEKPLTSNEPRLLMEKPKFMQVLQKLNTRLTP